MTEENWHRANEELRRNIGSAVPWIGHGVGWLYARHRERQAKRPTAGRMVETFGHRFWDTCGPEAGDRCRHNMPMPPWMLPPPRAA